MGIGFVGIVFILHPDHEMFQLPSFIALLSGILGAIGISLIRALSKVGSLRQILFYNFFLATVVAGLVSIFAWVPITKEDFIILLGVGICGALYQLFSTLTYKKIPVRVSSSFMFLCILFGTLLDWVVLGLIPVRETLIGMGLVILGGLRMLYFGKRYVFSPKP